MHNAFQRLLLERTPGMSSKDQLRVLTLLAGCEGAMSSEVWDNFLDKVGIHLKDDPPVNK